MTDSEIIKALNKWLKEMHNAYKIHLESGGRKDTDHEEYIDLMTNTIDLINRQKAEIERLKEENNHFADIGKMYSEIKSEAIKDFAEKVLDEIREAIISNDKAIKEREEKHNVNRYEDNFCSMYDGKITALGGIRYFINNLVKEMVGDSNA